MALATTSPLPSPWPEIPGRDILRLKDLTSDEILNLLQLAQEMKLLRARRMPFTPLSGRTLALLFEKSSTRTRVSFGAGFQQLGGHVLELSPTTLQLSRGETVEDTARVLSLYVDALMVRTGPHERLETLAHAATIPVINGLSDAFHPCQLLADLLTIQERFGHLHHIVVAYIGDGSNMANSWLEAAAMMGMGLRLAVPEGFEPPAALLAWANEEASSRGGGVFLTHDPHQASMDADIIYTDVWVSMGQEDEREIREKAFAPFQVNCALLQKASPHALFMHCLPAHRGQEVASGVIDGPKSIVWEQAENRLHAQNALMVSLLAN